MWGAGVPTLLAFWDCGGGEREHSAWLQAIKDMWLPPFLSQLQNQNELRAPTAEKAAFYLDAALAARSTSRAGCGEDARRSSHMLFTLHVYQYRVEKCGQGGSRCTAGGCGGVWGTVQGVAMPSSQRRVVLVGISACLGGLWNSVWVPRPQHLLIYVFSVWRP